MEDYQIRTKMAAQPGLSMICCYLADPDTAPNSPDEEIKRFPHTLLWIALNKRFLGKMKAWADVPLVILKEIDRFHVTSENECEEIRNAIGVDRLRKMIDLVEEHISKSIIYMKVNSEGK